MVFFVDRALIDVVGGGGLWWNEDGEEAVVDIAQPLYHRLKRITNLEEGEYHKIEIDGFDADLQVDTDRFGQSLELPGSFIMVYNSPTSPQRQNKPAKIFKKLSEQANWNERWPEAHKLEHGFNSQAGKIILVHSRWTNTTVVCSIQN